MKRFSTAFFTVLLVFAVVGTMMAQGPTARIVIRGGSPGNILANPSEFSTSSNGLPNVGKGSIVYLEAKALTGASPNWHYDTLTVVSWQILSAPAGSVATIDPTDTANGLMGSTARFVPDTVGQWLIGLTVTTLNGTSTQVTKYINAANYVGVGTLIDGTANAPECAGCHDGSVVSDKVTPWKGTLHSSMLTRGINGLFGSHYSGSCISCHTTGFDKTPTAVNAGFDDRMTQYGWTFPDTLVPGNWDSMKANYPEVAKLANIQCESCHGPGSKHNGVFSKNQVAVSWSAEVCGQCHDAPTHHVKNFDWKASAHANSMAEGEEIEHMNSTSCSRCHTGQGYVDVVIDGGTSAAPYADVAPVTCVACHDPHSADHPGQLRRASLADACTGCHMNRISTRGLHHSNQGPMLAGTTGIPYGGQTGIGDWGGWQLAGYTYTNSAHTSITDKCVVCHMAATPADSLAGKLGDHTFKVAYEVDSTTTIFNTNGCVCHGTGGATAVTQSYVDDSQAKIQVLLDTLAALLPQKTPGVPYSHLDTSYHFWTPTKKAGSYNYFFVTNDGSGGVHNHDYAVELLTASIEQLKLTAGATSITSIADVPNDQGKQVQIIWPQFPTELLSLDPVVEYGVWRQDPMPGATPATAKATSFRSMFAKGSVGSQFVLGGSVWTYVGSVPAAKQTTYSYIAPTLFDSTIVSGMKQTTFYVTGMTKGGVVYSTPADSGYSIDNLSPPPPAGFNASVVSTTVHLGWQLSSAKDVDHFAVYKGTDPGFDPHAGDPLAKISDTSYVDASVQSGNTYYYYVTAVDFSGNESPLSTRLEVIVSGVNEGRGIPTEFALSQNFPNPFNPTTQIGYQVPTESHVKITVYNTLGVEVATVVDKEQQAGYYNVVWDGKDNKGQTVGSGLYLYRMTAGSFNVVKKMVFMK